MTSVSKNVQIDKLNDIVNKYNNTYNSAIKMKPFDVDFDKNNKPDDFDKNNKKDPKFKIGDHVRIPKYKIVYKRLRSILV